MNPDTISTDSTEQGLKDELEQETCMIKFRQFKKDYLKMRKMYEDASRENQVLQKYITALETKSSSEESNSIFFEAVKQQKTIVDHLQRKDDYLAMQNLCDTLQKRIRELEMKLQNERAFYEEEIKKIAEKAMKETNDLNKDYQKNAAKRIQQLEISNQELIQTNEVLKALMDEFTIDAENERAFLTTRNLTNEQEMEQQKETIRMLESRNKLLYEQLMEQEKCFERRINSLEDHEKDKQVFSSNTRPGRSHVETIDEAFYITQGIIEGTQENSPITPFTTHDCSDLFVVDVDEPNAKTK